MEDKNILYTAVVLDNESHNNLVSYFKQHIPDNWKIFAHHMTIHFGGKSPEKYHDDIGKIQALNVTHFGMSNMAIAVRVEGYPSENKIPHITLAVNVDRGGKPFMSNKITDWKKISLGLTLRGEVTEIKRG